MRDTTYKTTLLRRYNNLQDYPPKKIQHIFDNEVPCRANKYCNAGSNLKNYHPLKEVHVTPILFPYKLEQ